MMVEIFRSCWEACVCDDPYEPVGSEGLPPPTPFVADAIISNPVTYVHVHCAEALGKQMNPLLVFLYRYFV